MCRLWHTQNTDPDTSSPLDVSIIKINWMFFIEQSEPTKRWHIRLQHIARQDFWIVQKKRENTEKLFNISREANKEEVWSACCFNRVAQTNNVSDEKGKAKKLNIFRLTFSRQSCAERKTKRTSRRKSIELNFRQWVLLWYTKKNSWRRKLCDNYLCEPVPIRKRSEHN